ncbi:hypothetical protein [Vibrio quintilis]|uniref:Uncharacterized protein n=1 Tax=Vibrio quintilis TaxID=1117707 RepID=A0A1M7Z2U5_9VIBR|nr:hypothetical protein [Vibrio quintilis]SHO59277.1 hypothetical protein VQ7734_05057 [Vibrio quintilis]
MKFSRTVLLAKGSEIVGEIELNCSVVKNTVYISYIDSFSEKGNKNSSGFFYALAEIREDYSEKELVLLCKGSQESVFPGGLTSESSFGELAYEMDDIIGEPKVVNIFDSIGISDLKSVASIEEQKLKRLNIIRSKQQPQQFR